MVRNIIGIIFYVIAAFFIYTVGLLAFFNVPEVGSFKFAIMGGFIVPALIFMMLGAVMYRSSNWRSSAGVVLLSAAGFDLLLVITIISMQMSPEIDEFIPDNNLSSFNDYLLGFAVMVIQACLGGLLLKAGKRRITGQSSSAPL